MHAISIREETTQISRELTHILYCTVHCPSVCHRGFSLSHWDSTAALRETVQSTRSPTAPLTWENGYVSQRLCQSSGRAVTNDSSNPLLQCSALKQHESHFAWPLDLGGNYALGLKVHAEGERGWGVVNLLDPLDPDAVVCDVEVVQYVGRFILPEDCVNIQQALQDAGFPWTGKTEGVEIEKCYFMAM